MGYLDGYESVRSGDKLKQRIVRHVGKRLKTPSF